MGENVRVLFLSPEAVPFAKTGGLADVAGALPGALKRLGADVRLILPLYGMVKKGGFNLRPCSENLEVSLGNERLRAMVWETKTEEGVPVYLLEREDLYDRPNLYGNALGDYYDNLERFTFYSHAALRLAEAMGFQPTIIHCHDWQTGLVPALIKGPFQESAVFQQTATVFTIHNLGYQGLFPEEKVLVTGLAKGDFFHPEGLEYWGKMSLLKAGIVYSQAITTVSPTYAKEIQTSDYGMGMEGILRQRRDHLYGILNGVDYERWDPAVDPHLPAKYSAQKMSGKDRCKESLIEEMNLDPFLRDRPLLGMITRLDIQKGLDLLVEILDDVLDLTVGLVILGSGDEHIQKAIRKAGERHPGRVGIRIGFDDALAHRIIAGSDLFLIPSRYEPCGLTQMYAMKYGTVPVVRATGGLEDTVVSFDRNTEQGNGFKFSAYHPKAFYDAIRGATDLFEDERLWRRLRANGMAEDFSWNRSARAYLEIYRTVTR